MVEPISDDELQVVRDALSDYVDYPEQVHHLQVNGRLTAGLLARLDAAELRAAELQREIDLLIADSANLLRPVHADGCPCGECDWDGEIAVDAAVKRARKERGEPC